MYAFKNKKLRLFVGFFMSVSLCFPMLGFATSSEVNNDSQQSDGFSDNKIDPFYVCTTQNPAKVQVFNGVVKTSWTERGYDGTRMDKGAEACSDVEIFSEAYYGFKFMLPSAGDGKNGYPRYPNNKEAAIAQIMQHGYCSSWAAMLVVRNNQLRMLYRANCGTPEDVLLLDNISRNTYHDVVINFKPSNEYDGRMRVWIDGRVAYLADKINFGFGEWNDNDTLAEGNKQIVKFGQYNFDGSDYIDDEVRTVYYDNVTIVKGSAKYNTAKP